jgi:hypothetical protein
MYLFKLPTTPKSFDSTVDQAMELTLKPKRRLPRLFRAIADAQHTEELY